MSKKRKPFFAQNNKCDAFNHLKSLNQFYNKQIATIKENKPQGFWSKKLAAITRK